MEKLLAGVVRFHRDVFPDLFARRAPGEPAAPLALFITCADARVVPHLITQTDPGELFGCQVVGNIVPAYGSTYGGVSATIEYALSVLGVQDVIVCGHSDCGAMKVLLDPSAVADYPSVQEWLSHAEAARRTVLEDGDLAHLAQPLLLDALIEQNVVTQLVNLRTHPAIAARLPRGRVRLHGWVYDVDTGAVRAYDEQTGRYGPIDGELGEPATTASAPPY